jgi:hypothetical protein
MTSRALKTPGLDRKRLPFNRALSPLGNINLTIDTPMSLRGLRSRSPGLLPYGMPARMAFSTVAIRYLFEEFTPGGLFFPLKAQKTLRFLRSFS